VPKVVRQVRAEYTVEQIVILLVPTPDVLGDVDADVAIHFWRELHRWPAVL